jgi:hypothetical protein
VHPLDEVDLLGVETDVVPVLVNCLHAGEQRGVEQDPVTVRRQERSQ